MGAVGRHALVKRIRRPHSFLFVERDSEKVRWACQIGGKELKVPPEFVYFQN